MLLDLEERKKGKKKQDFVYHVGSNRINGRASFKLFILYSRWTLQKSVQRWVVKGTLAEGSQEAASMKLCNVN